MLFRSVLRNGRGLSLSQPPLLRSTSSRRAGSVVVAHGPSCSVACGIFPDQGSNPCPLHWQTDSQPLRHQGSPVLNLFYVRKLSDNPVEAMNPLPRKVYIYVYACALEGFNISVPTVFLKTDKKKKANTRASLVAQWLRICLPMQATRVRALVWEDPTCHGATRPVNHNY